MSDINWDETGYLFALANKEKSLVEFFELKPSTSNCEECWMVDSSETLYLKDAWVLFERPETKPVYTQAMCDAGELPPIGSLFIDVELNDTGDDTPVLAIAHDLPLKRVVYRRGDTLIDSEYFGAVAHECKPITPPIELIDGRAYQFDYHDLKDLVGVYFKPDEDGFDILKGTFGSINAPLATNIFLLTPEGEK